jgi:hypothetical protein
MMSYGIILENSNTIVCSWYPGTSGFVNDHVSFEFGMCVFACLFASLLVIHYVHKAKLKSDV